jgi:predicted component of type VI protein secretion system
VVIIYSRGQSTHLGKRYMLAPSPEGCWVGRGSDNAIVLESDTASRRHARFELRGESWWVVDNNSTNGTYVNDEPTPAACLRNGDHIKIGDTIFKYLTGSDVESEFIPGHSGIQWPDDALPAPGRRG